MKLVEVIQLRRVFVRMLVAYTMFLGLIGCRHRPVLVGPTVLMAPDSVILRSIGTTDGNNRQLTLVRGRRTSMNAELQYTLASQDKAILEVNLDQFHSPDTCTRDVEGMVKLLPKTRIPITRGTHIIALPLVWPGDTGEGAGGVIFGKGAVSLETSFVTQHYEHSVPGAKFGTLFCLQF